MVRVLKVPTIDVWRSSQINRFIAIIASLHVLPSTLKLVADIRFLTSKDKILSPRPSKHENKNMIRSRFVHSFGSLTVPISVNNTMNTKIGMLNKFW